MFIGFGLLAVVIGMLPVCLAYPWIGMLMWAWLGYMVPHRLTWGITHDLPFAMMVAVATVVGLAFTRDRRPIPWVRETYLLAALWAVFTLSTVFAMYPEMAWDQWWKVSKVLLFTFLPLLVLQEPRRLRWFLLVIALSLGFYGLKGGIWALATGGGNRVMMPEGSNLAGSNGAALALNMALPLLWYLAKEESNRWLRRLLRVTFVFSIPAVLFTYSRGGVLGLGAVLAVLALKAKRTSAVFGLALVALFVYAFAPAEWMQRMETIQSYEEDGSAMARLDAWYIAFRLALDRPLLGGGFWSMSATEVVQRYIPHRRFNVNSHSIFFNVMAEHGFIGLGVYLALIGSCVASLHRLRREHASAQASWVRSYSHMLEVSLVGYLVTGAFLSAAYLDLFYHMVTSVILLRVVAARMAVREPRRGETEVAGVARRRVPVLAGGSQ